MIRDIIREEKLHADIGKSELFYTFKNEGDYWETARKILNEQTNEGLLPCHRIMFNGRTRLVYFVKNCKAIKGCTDFNREDVLRILEEILNILHLVVDNEFLSSHNLVFDVDKIFIDAESNSVYMVYVPYNLEDIDADEFDFEIRNSIINIIECFDIFSISELERIKYHIMNVNLGIKELAKYISGFVFDHDDGEIGETVDDCNIYEETAVMIENTHRLMICKVLVSLDMANPCTLIIDKPEYVIGKKSGMVDGLIDFNPAISRVHCKVIEEDEVTYIIDMNSSNRTYLNGVALSPGEKYPLKISDVVRLANSDFEVQEVEV